MHACMGSQVSGPPTGEQLHARGGRRQSAAATTKSYGLPVAEQLHARGRAAAAMADSSNKQQQQSSRRRRAKEEEESPTGPVGEKKTASGLRARAPKRSIGRRGRSRNGGPP